MLKNYLAALSACTFTGAFAVAALATMLDKVPTVTGIGLSLYQSVSDGSFSPMPSGTNL